MDFANWLHSQLTIAGWEQADLARRTGISKTQISNVLSGVRQAGPEFCIAVARAFGISREEVFQVRGWLLSSSAPVLQGEADPQLMAMVEVVRTLPLEQRQRIIYAWDATLRAAGISYEIDLRSD